MARGIAPRAACRSALVGPLTDDPELLGALHDLVSATF
jgi:nitric oxide reductase NorQ protein